MIRLAVALAILSGAAPAAAHEWYVNQKSPDGIKPCCNNQDCAPREVRLNMETVTLEIFLEGKWWTADDPRWFLGASPDGSWHGCMLPRDAQPRCVWGGAGT